MSKIKTPTIRVVNLILEGEEKSYSVGFNPGVNIIYGDTDTGKTSILEIIDYLFGAKKFESYEEIELAVGIAAIEVRLNNILYTIRRDLYKFKNHIEVYRCEYSEIENSFPEKYAPTYSLKEGPDGYFSDFMFTSLGMASVKIKSSPSKDDSKMSRLSFRDLFKYCFIDQENVGDKRFLDLGDYIKRTKNKETFKYIYNLLDENTARLQSEISNQLKIKNELERKLIIITDFLRETGFGTEVPINDDYDQVEERISSLELSLEELSRNIIESSEAFSALNKEYKISLNKKEDLNKKIQSTKSDIEKYIKLNNDYTNDIAKMDASLEAKYTLGEIDNYWTPCPLCDSVVSSVGINEKLSLHDSDKLKDEKVVLKRRKRQLTELISNDKLKLDSYRKELMLLDNELLSFRGNLDEKSKDVISPFIAVRDSIVSKLSELRERKSRLRDALKVRSKRNNIVKKINSLEDSVSKLTSQLDTIIENAPSTSDVISKLGATFNNYLKKININKRKNVSISEKSFMPVVRNRNYESIKSGGLRTISSIGYILSIMESGINRGINLPRFVMIDTVGKYIGKTNERYLDGTDERADAEEGFSDPEKYQNIFEHIIDLAEITENKGETSQFILVDNDVPPIIQKKYKGFVIAHFSSSGKDELPKGLIDDENIHNKETFEKVGLAPESVTAIKKSVIKNDELLLLPKGEGKNEE